MLFVIGPATLTNAEDAPDPDAATAGVVELAVTAFSSNCPELDMLTPYADAFEPPVIVPLTVTVPETADTPCALSPEPPVHAPVRVTFAVPLPLIPVALLADPPVTLPVTFNAPPVPISMPPADD